MQRHSGLAGTVQLDAPGICLRTRCRRQDAATACHTPGCPADAVDGRRFCAGCQRLLDRVRRELRPARKPRI